MCSWLILTRTLGGGPVPSRFTDEKMEIQGVNYVTGDSAGVGQPQLDPAVQSWLAGQSPEALSPGVVL